MIRSTLLAVAFALPLFSFAQVATDARLAEIKKMTKEDSLGWNRGAGIGLDLAGMGLLNPRPGSGTARLGLGGIGTLYFNFKGEKTYWNNSGSIQLSAQRLGRTTGAQPAGFQKNLDVLQFNSRYGLKLNADKWFIAADATARTQLLKTYASNFLQAVDSTDRVVSKFFAPLQLTFSPGIDFKPNANLSFFFSPAAVQYILVSDDAIAETNIFGNDKGKNYFLGLGAEFKAGYSQKFLNDKISITSNLRLFSNYLKEPQNIDVLWGTNLSLQLFKGLSLDLVAEYLYDHDVLVQKDVNNDGVYNVIINPDGTTEGDDRLGRGAQITGAFLLKYSIIF